MNNNTKRIAICLYDKTWRLWKYHIKLFAYRLGINKKVKRIRQKEIIKVLYVVSEIASWKSEMLYLAMLNHPRFKPLLSISTSYSPPNAKEPLKDYLKSKQYEYIDLDDKEQSIEKIDPDIIFYYKPYGLCYSDGHFYDKHLNYLFCGMDYCFSITKHLVHLERPLYDYCWQFYVEHNDVNRRRKELFGYRARNVLVTGVPMQDILLLPKDKFLDPWIDKLGKKRIIYAPHHSIKGTNGEGIEYATFLEFGEPMLEFAKKYSDTITIAFKPHPNLYMKLLKIWGEERTDAYYQAWNNMSNTQLETGEYIGLFKYSDAIIHDSASFIVEYLYMNKPSMYLVAETNNMEDMFDYVQEGFDCYEHGYCVQDIELFIQNVISGVDKKKGDRKKYINTQLLPPNGKTACENIINSILFK